MPSAGRANGNLLHHLTTTLQGLLSGAPLLFAGLPLVLLGICAAYLAGLRDRLLILACAVPAAVGLLVVTSQVHGALGLGLPLAAVAALSLLLPLLWGQLTTRLPLRGRSFRGRPNGDASPDGPSPNAVEPREPVPWQVWAGASLGSVLGLLAWLPGIADPALPGQNVDDVWHGYVVRRMEDMDSVTAGSMTPIFPDRAEPTTFYPYGLHLAAAVLRSLPGVETALALNAMWAVAIGVMLPFAVAALLWVLVPARPWAAAYGAVAASAVQFFPYALTGVQPYSVAVAMIPGSLVLVVLVARPVAGVSARSAGFLLAVSSVAVLVTHPAAGAAFAVLAALVAAESALSNGLRRVHESGLRLLFVGLGALLFAFPFLRAASSTYARIFRSDDAPIPNTADALRQLALLKTLWTPSGHYVLALAVVLGLVSAVVWRRRGWSLAAGYVVFAALYVGTSTGATWAQPFVGPWYAEWHRLAGLVFLLVPPLVGIGADAVHDVVGRAMARQQLSWRNVRVVAVGVVATLLALVAFREIAVGVVRAQSTLLSTWNPVLVTRADVELYREVGRRVDSDEIVLNNWYDGSTWMYAYAGARPAVPYTLSGTPEWDEVFANLSDPTPTNCRSLRDRRVTHALAKTVTIGNVPNPFLASALANPTLFRPEVTAPNGMIFELNQGFLRDCAAR